jgi:opacity protein-like surface antigen
MFRALKIALIAGCTVLGFANAGLTSDLDIPIFADQAPDLQPVEIGNGWYIRGDIGLNFNGKHNSSNYEHGNVKYLDEFADKVTAGVGVGYQLNDFLRVDGGIEHLFASNFSATSKVAPRGPCHGKAQPLVNGQPSGPEIDWDIVDCFDIDTAKYSAINSMANAYVDLGTYVGFTPYVGAGIGLARVEWEEVTDSTLCVPEITTQGRDRCVDATATPQPVVSTPYTQKGITNTGTDYRMSYALMAGVGYKASKNLTLDLSYRILNVGGKDIAYSTVTPGSGMAKDGFGTQQVRLGFRYSLW